VQYRELDEVSDTDIHSLIVERRAEDTRLEYKMDLPGKTPADRAEFAKDVTALANAEGGDIVFGMASTKGIASALKPIDNALIDDTKNRLHQILDNGVIPRVPRVKMQPIEVETGKCVLIVRVPQSHLGPHQVTVEQSYKFHGRNSTGTYVMEVDELRDRILRQASFVEQVREFRRARVGLIKDRPVDMPTEIKYERKLIMHFLPEETFARVGDVDVAQLVLQQDKLQYVMAHTPVQSAHGMDRRTNIDGVLFMSPGSSAAFGWYVQVFGDGSVEFVDGFAFFNAENEPVMYPAAVEHDLFGGYQFASRVLRTLGITGRVYVATSALGVRDLSLRVRYRRLPSLAADGRTNIGRDPAFFNEVLVEDIQATQADEALFPVVAQLWRACGFEKPLSYNDDHTYNANFYR